MVLQRRSGFSLVLFPEAAPPFTILFLNRTSSSLLISIFSNLESAGTGAYVSRASSDGLETTRTLQRVRPVVLSYNNPLIPPATPILAARAGTGSLLCCSSRPYPRHSGEAIARSRVYNCGMPYVTEFRGSCLVH